MTQVPFPALIDNTQRTTFVRCETKWANNFLSNLTSIKRSIHLFAGGAFASGLEATRRAFYEQGLNSTQAVAAGIEAIIAAYGDHEYEELPNADKSWENLVLALESYFQQYPLETDWLAPFVMANGRAGIEFTFAIPTEINHPETGNPILYGGRFDMLARVRQDSEAFQQLPGGDLKLFIDDEKTASALGQAWRDKWELESQFLGYIYAARAYGYPVLGAVVRGVGLLKTKISHEQVLLLPSDHMLLRWWDQLHLDLERMIQVWKSGRARYALADACSMYGGCEFRLACLSPAPESWLKVGFVSKNWDPLAKNPLNMTAEEVAALPAGY